MANMHVRGKTPRGYQVVCHFAIPATLNSAGLAWRVAYARSRPTALTTVLPDGDGSLGTIAAAEKTSMTQATPTVAEDVQEFDIPDNWDAMTGPQRLAAIDAWYTLVTAEWQARLSGALLWWGLTR